MNQLPSKEFASWLVHESLARTTVLPSSKSSIVGLTKINPNHLQTCHVDGRCVLERALQMYVHMQLHAVVWGHAEWQSRNLLIRSATIDSPAPTTTPQTKKLGLAQLLQDSTKVMPRLSPPLIEDIIFWISENFPCISASPPSPCHFWYVSHQHEGSIGSLAHRRYDIRGKQFCTRTMQARGFPSGCGCETEVMREADLIL